ncbi:MAG: hydrogenase maturation protease [Actinomycetia bacterium]|nr:hydrogenase maturation protease [Actinomycetes bacterium]
MNPLVIGVGNRWRGDDGLGPRAVEALERRLPGLLDVMVLDGEPARLVAAWEGRPWVLVVDAVRTGCPPGTIHRLDALTAAVPPHPTCSSHGAGVDTGVALGRALDRLPGELVVFGIEPADLDHGDHLSDPVAAAFDDLLDRIEREVRSACV